MDCKFTIEEIFSSWHHCGDYRRPVFLIQSCVDVAQDFKLFVCSKCRFQCRHCDWRGPVKCRVSYCCLVPLSDDNVLSQLYQSCGRLCSFEFSRYSDWIWFLLQESGRWWRKSYPCALPLFNVGNSYCSSEELPGRAGNICSERVPASWSKLGEFVRGSVSIMIPVECGNNSGVCVVSEHYKGELSTSLLRRHVCSCDHGCKVWTANIVHLTCQKCGSWRNCGCNTGNEQ